MTHQIAKVDKVTCDDALEFSQLIQDGPPTPVHKQGIMDSIRCKVDLTEDSSDHNVSPMDYTSN